VLANLELEAKDDSAPVIPDSFLGLGGFAPDLRTLSLTRIPIPFPGLRKLLLSATDLVFLSLSKISHSGHFPPEAMALVTCLSALTRLQVLIFEFESLRSRPYRENRCLPPPMRALLPALQELLFTEVSEYLEDLVAQIDAPLLDCLDIIFFHQLIFDTPQLAQFISRSSRRQRDEVHHEAGVIVSLPEPFAFGLKLEISCRQSDWQLSGASL